MNFIAEFPTMQHSPSTARQEGISSKRRHECRDRKNEVPLIYVIGGDTELDPVLFSLYTKSRRYILFTTV